MIYLTSCCISYQFFSVLFDRVESDEESTLSSLLDDLDAVRANAALELELDDIDTDTSIDIDMDETIDAPPVAAEVRA